MSWLNNSLNTIKGQLTTFAHEILEETAGPGDSEYRPTTSTVDNKTAIELLVDSQKDKDVLDKLCSEKDVEVSTDGVMWKNYVYIYTFIHVHMYT